MEIKVVFGEKMNAVSGSKESPSAHKPAEMARFLKAHPVEGLEIAFVEPDPLTIDDFCLCHDRQYVEGVMALKLPNGFGTLSQSVCDSLPYTNGSMLAAAKAASAGCPAAALCSGFHHAGWGGCMPASWFCTFNGLMIAATKLVAEGKKVAIVDCDMHWGNGTDDILSRMRIGSLASAEADEGFGRRIGPYYHATFGRHFLNPSHAAAYLVAFWRLQDELEAFGPDAILYQSGADVHVDDPFGGVLTEEQMTERDLRMFGIAKGLKAPLAWNLAGGYQHDENGSIDKVLNLHLNTFKACAKAFSGTGK
jgi:acetoin utilization deacetylase AcuC-like enzyme